jgi:hypothetical protein
VVQQCGALGWNLQHGKHDVLLGCCVVLRDTHQHCYGVADFCRDDGVSAATSDCAVGGELHVRHSSTSLYLHVHKP